VWDVELFVDIFMPHDVLTSLSKHWTTSTSC